MDKPEPTPPEQLPHGSDSASRQTSYWLIPIVFITPALISLLATWCRLGEAVIAIDFCASILAGIICSWLIIRNSSLDVPLSIFFFLFLVPVFGLVAFVISILGCLIGQNTGGTSIRIGG